jgi:hypothetical protein
MDRSGGSASEMFEL